MTKISRPRAALVSVLAATGLTAACMGVSATASAGEDGERVRADCSAVGFVRVLPDGSQRVRSRCVVPAPKQATVTATATATVTVTATPKPSPDPSTTPTPDPEPSSPPTSQPTGGFPTLQSAGTPAGWSPEKTVAGLRVTTPGQVVEDVRVTGDLIVAAPNVTLRRVDVVGGSINNDAGGCQNGLKIEDSTVRRSTAPTSGDFPAVLAGGYTATNVLIDGLPEGFRAGGRSIGCGPVTVIDSYANVAAPDRCGDWHGDGLQGYDGPALTLRNTVLNLAERSDCGGTSAFFYPSGQGNTSVSIDGLVVKGGGFPFRLGMPGTVKGLHVVDGSWGYGPIDVKCSALSSWQASVSRLGADGQPQVVRSLPCNTNGGS